MVSLAGVAAQQAEQERLTVTARGSGPVTTGRLTGRWTGGRTDGQGVLRIYCAHCGFILFMFWPVYNCTVYIFLSKIMIEVLYDEVSLIVDKVGGRRPLHGMDKVGMLLRKSAVQQSFNDLLTSII